MNKTNTNAALTKSSVRRWADRVIRQANSDAAVVLKIAWINGPAKVTFPTGLRGWVGTVVLTAPGFRTRRMFVDADDTGLRVC